METDLHNLVPAVGELNGDRSNRPFGMVVGEPRAYGRCDFEVDFSIDVVEPRPKVRGNIARIYLYLHRVYGMTMDEQQLQFFKIWDQADPPDDWERERNRRIRAVHGRGNPFVERNPLTHGK